ncbi:CPBP family intramembrane glutamic endopeptidase [Lacticaseibacillus baoqingensis]|uniref:CPBP family intramembrane glutamic endopeptidase n=1 Tax=Lacticaseibacillus baoqingensis TaxID=2486013 RepID=A0ABW4E7C7_9LACO|nr:type II CAAX endopeptidase family protein [Lacticaseibacillus baoqingensis]
MTIGKFLGRIAAVVALFALYSVAQAISVVPTIVTNGKAGALIVAGVFTIAFGGLLYLLAAVYQYFLRFEKPAVYGPRHLDKKVARFMVGMVLALAATQLLNGIGLQLHWTQEASNQEALTALLKQAPLAMVLVAVVGAPPVEELLFRGLLMHCFPHQDQRGWLWFSGSVSALVFGLLHAGPSEPFAWALYTAMGAIFAATYAYTKDIRYSMTLHFLNNFIALFL